MTVTIKDVAKAAGVAPATVSRVIADYPRISDATKKRVRKTMEELGYYPNVNARSLANKTSKSIGLVLPEGCEEFFNNPFFPEVIRGISDYFQQQDYSLYFTTGKNDEDLMQNVEKMVKGKRVDGIILLYAKVSDHVLEFLSGRKFPTVVIGRPYLGDSQITTVDTNNVLASRDATNYLIKKGHTKIGFVGGSSQLSVTNERLRGYEFALLQAQIDVNPNFVYLDVSIGSDVTKQLMKNNEHPSALVIVDDLIALDVMSHLSEAGFQVPEDISVISFNNSYISKLTYPKLTTMDINIYRLGFESAKTIIDSITDKDFYPKQVYIAHSIVERDSCKELLVSQT